jgi:hypothetical protein
MSQKFMIKTHAADLLRSRHRACGNRSGVCHRFRADCRHYTPKYEIAGGIHVNDATAGAGNRRDVCAPPIGDRRLDDTHSICTHKIIKH